MTDPNVIYGGDIEEPVNYATLGEMLVSCFKEGGDKLALVINFLKILNAKIL